LEKTIVAARIVVARVIDVFQNFISR